MQSDHILSTSQTQVLKSSRLVRRDQYKQDKELQLAAGPTLNNDPLVLVELRAHAHDALNPCHDRDRMSLISFAPAVVSRYNVCDTCIAPMHGRCTCHKSPPLGGLGYA